MKTGSSITSLVFLTLCACSSEDYFEEPIPQEVTNTNEEVYMQFSPYFVEPENTTRGNRALTRAAVSEFATRLDIWLISGDNVTTVNQVSTQDGFGSLTITLDKTKTYTLYAFAHNGNAVATLSEGIISYPSNKVTASFFYTTTFSPATTTSIEAEMPRVTGQFRLEITEAIPDDVTQMKFTTYQTNTQFNVTNQTSLTPIDKETLYTSISKNSDGTAAFTITLMPTNLTERSYFDIKVEALASDNSVVKERTLEDVYITAGHRTRARCAFFTDKDFSLSLSVTDYIDDDYIYY